MPFDQKIQPKHPTEPLKYWAKLLKPEEKIKSSAGCFESLTEFLKSSAVCLCYSIIYAVPTAKLCTKNTLLQELLIDFGIIWLMWIKQTRACC